MTVAAVVGSLTLTAGPSFAGDAPSGGVVVPQACPTGQYYVETVVNRSYFFPMGIKFTSGPSNGTLVMHSSIENNVGVTATISGTVSFSASAIIASAKVDLGLSVSGSVSVSQTYVTDWGPIPNHLYGHMQFGSWGYRLTWILYRDNANCTTTKLGTGSAYLPNPVNLGFHTWNSSTANS